MNRTEPGAARPTDKRYSYSSTKMGFSGRANELFQLLKMARNPPTGSVAFTLETIGNTEKRIRDLTGVKLEGLRVLDIGPGQQLRHMRCLSLKNDVVGIDTDIIPQGFRVGEYLKMLRHNTVMRTVKTIARKGLGRDARFSAALAKELGVEKFKDLSILRMNACQMTFPSDHFGLVCSYSVFEHIDNPRAALAEVKRVLQPGGVAYISVHIYTSHSGAHDPTIMAGGKPHEPFWPHLRAEYRDAVQPSTFMNKLSLAEWKQIFNDVMPGVHFVNERQDHEIGDGLEKIRANGELTEYTDEELMTVNFIGIWKKPE